MRVRTCTSLADVPTALLERASSDGIVVMAGAGVSAVPPSSLPGWYDLNARILDALRDRMESYLGRDRYVAPLVDAIGARRTSHRFPPDYQAQVLEENCGRSYFEALRALDVEVYNGVHVRLAHLAKHGVVRTIVTTNFDRLIERALDHMGVPYDVAYEPDSYALCEAALAAGAERERVQILKVHGCVQDTLSMVDTLKQRLLGRNEALNRALAGLLERCHWLFLGFSAGDLETDDGYLQLVPAAPKSPGITYIQWAGDAKLEPGAHILLEAYATKADHVVTHLEPFLDWLGEGLELPPVEASLPAPAVSTSSQVSATLSEWADAQHPATVVNCLASIFEVNGEALPAFQLLHRFWKDVIPRDREGENFARFRTHHGRLGVAGGLISLVDELSTDRGMESIQNLFRRQDDPRSAAWAGLAWIWAGRMDWAMPLLNRGGEAIESGECTPEESVDIWLACAEALFAIQHPESVLKDWPGALGSARSAGDLPREAKVAVMAALLFAEFVEDDYLEFMEQYAAPVLARAQRLHDPSIHGFDDLARGRYLTKRRAPAEAMAALDSALQHFVHAGRPPWTIYTEIQYVKALLDGGRMEEAADLVNRINSHVDSYQIWLPSLLEVKGQAYLMWGQVEEAHEAFGQAIEFATEMRLSRKTEALRRYLQQPSVVESAE